MTQSDRVVPAVLVVVLSAAVVLELTSVPGPWFTVAALVVTVTVLVTGTRTRRREHQEHEAAFAERIRRIRAGEIPPRDPPR